MIRSRLLTEAGFVHGFSTRAGGVSQPPFDTLNLGRALGDAEDSVVENHRRLAREVGYDVDRLYEVHQVHGAAVVAIEPDDSVGETRTRQADALIARHHGLAVGVRTADCVPILIADPERGVVAAIHAGWRGIVARVIASAIEALGSEPGTLIAAIGPHIRVRSFEVDEGVARQLAEAASGTSEDVVVDRKRTRPHVDLSAIVIAQLVELGVARTRIEDVGGDTFADAERFFSHRRDQARAGRHLSVIAAR